jgi:hypothetical protein
VAYVDVATVFREQIATQSILTDTLKKRDFLNVLVYLDGHGVLQGSPAQPFSMSHSWTWVTWYFNSDLSTTLPSAHSVILQNDVL